jgi:hypothetical protein
MRDYERVGYILEREGCITHTFSIVRRDELREGGWRWLGIVVGENVSVHYTNQNKAKHTQYDKIVVVNENNEWVATDSRTTLRKAWKDYYNEQKDKKQITGTHFCFGTRYPSDELEIREADYKQGE